MSKKLDKHEVVSRHKGSRLARRARSFKEDILGKINQMRTPGRAASPHKTKSKESSLDVDSQGEAESPTKGDKQVVRDMRQISNALRYFQDSVEKDTLGMLPGSASIVLEYVLHLISLLKKDFINDQSSVLMSTTTKLYQSLACFIKWADDVMLYREQATVEGVNHIVQDLQNSIQELVDIGRKNIQNKDLRGKSTTPVSTANGIYSTKNDSHRNSLPDIPLTPRERQILETTRIAPESGNGPSSVGPLYHSASSDSILSSSTRTEYPPPKPPLPLSCHSSNSNKDCQAPPLPPKKKSSGLSSTSNLLDPTSVVTASLFDDWHQGPLSGASSLDSCLHHSADDLLNISSPSVNFLPSLGTIQQVNYQTYSYNMCTTSVSSRSDSVDQLLSHSSSSSHISAMQKANTKVAASSQQSFEICGTRAVLRSPDGKPALPAKQRSVWNRTPSQYDNVSDAEDVVDSAVRSLGSWAVNETAKLSDDNPNHAPFCPHHSCVLPQPTSALSPLEDSRPPPLPPKKKTIMEYIQTFGTSHPAEQDFFSRRVQYSYHAQYNHVSFSSLGPDDFSLHMPALTLPDTLELGSPPALPPKKNKSAVVCPQDSNACTRQSCSSYESGSGPELPPALRASEDSLLDESGESLIDLQDVTEHLIFNENAKSRDVRGLKGGPVDALIVYAAMVRENVEKEYYYQEAFLTTYRVFVSSKALINKLIYRYNKFIQFSDSRQKYARWAFSLLVSVVDDLGLSDTDEAMLKCLTEFTHQLLSRGDLSLARALRAKVVEKCEAWRRRKDAGQPLLPDMHVTTQPATLLDFKSELLAEQMTLLDADLFQKIEISEVLIWAKEQNEESSPNLTKFTEHFNKMSYWARSCILKQSDAKDRERVVIKFIKIMKHLRKINNFNSYLAILSALDSAPVRRLEWQRNITEGLKEYCALIDSSSSFRAYRQALAETTPPCIPYIGLILQDLTFVHVGNTDYISDAIVNFTKCWQQFHILEPMRCFKKKPFCFKRHEQVIDFFNNFEDFLSEDAMWEISENIKPRGSQKK
ncbi:rap guanine nucleotide exchange factor 1-like [Ornithodoros turicata]|uniref:rap guanine nucleotide exchange factor 1-like n=1 Tax=Ornithodoros turicata TaxID=34597 RepID=UPI003138B68E